MQSIHYPLGTSIAPTSALPSDSEKMSDNSPTRPCHRYFLCRIFAKHYQSILDLGMRIPRELFAFGFLVEPLSVLVSEFEDRNTRFFTGKAIVDES
jgi:hypothetical protein